jgi:hypothetical protein
VKYFLLKPYTAETLLTLFRVVLDSKSFPLNTGQVGRVALSPPAKGTGRSPAIAADKATR